MNYKTLSEAVDAIYRQRIATGECEIVGDFYEPWGTATIYPTCAHRESYELLSHKGKRTRKHLHAIVTRKDNGNYEITSYVL